MHIDQPLNHHHHGLAADLEVWVQRAAQRRSALRWLAAGGIALGLPACGGGGSDSGSTTPTGGNLGGGNVTGCSVIPEETAGPFPGDASNSSGGTVANALALSGIVRSDIRASVGGATGVAAGTPLTMKIQLVNTGASCANLGSYAIYLWHCDALGRYSMYSSGVTAQNYLRGVQATGTDGVASFTTIFPGCYAGRMPHLHLEVYRSLATATTFSNKIKTSQIAFPNSSSSAVYALSTYPGSAANLASISFATDNVFSDGVTTQTATMTGSVAANDLQASLVVGIAA
jgi:protocatechuate 3,4-dioxygenase beta subunit